MKLLIEPQRSAYIRTQSVDRQYVEAVSTVMELVYNLHAELTSSSSDSASLRKRLDTERKASSGHSWNQSMLVQFTIAGNFRARTLRVEPTGEKHNTTCIV